MASSSSTTMSRGAPSYAELAKGSLFAAKVEHGLQTGAIYWETNMNPYNGAFGQGTYSFLHTMICISLSV